MKYKKLLCTILSLVMIFGAIGFTSGGVAYAGSVFNDVDDTESYMPYLAILRAIGVVSGGPDGNFRPYDGLTRAEFAKLAVHMLDQQDSVSSNVGSPLFDDISRDHWALGYINYAVKNSYIVGYPDGTFHPEESLTYAQAVTIVLRLLGYQAADVGKFWPSDYLQRAASMGLTEGMNVSADAAIPRCDTIVLLGRALETEMNTKATSGLKIKLISNFGYWIIDETVVIATEETFQFLKSGEVTLSGGTYKTLTESIKGMVGQKVKVYFNDEDEIVLAIPLKQYSMKATIEKHLEDDRYTLITDSGIIEHKFDNFFNVYHNGALSTYINTKIYIEPGAQLTFYGKYDGRWEYAMLSDAQKVTPFIAGKDVLPGETSVAGVSIANPSELTIYRDGLRANFTDIKRYDVIYYNPAIKTMDVYIDKVTGVYDKAMPNKAYVTSVQLGGKTYAIETREATSKLDETAGSYKIGDRMTLLLGKDGKIAGVANIQNDASLEYGVVVNTSSEPSQEDDNKGEVEHYASIFMGDSQTYKFETTKNYSDLKGKLVHMTFEKGICTLKQGITTELTGELNVSARVIGTKSLASGAVFFDLVSNESGQDAKVVKIDAVDIKTSTLYRYDVLGYATTQGFSDVGVVLFNNITASGDKFGIVTYRNVSKDGSSGTFKVDIVGIEYTTSGAKTYAVSVGEPVRVVMSGNNITSITMLSKVTVGSAVEAVDYDRIRVGGTVYTMDPDVAVYKYDNKLMKYISVSQNTLKDKNIMQVELYSDKLVQNGGKVRVIKLNLSVN